MGFVFGAFFDCKEELIKNNSDLIQGNSPMKLAQTLLFITSAVFLNGCIVIANPSYADHHVQKELTIDAKQLSTFDIEAGAGSLVITGSDSVFDITVIADIYTDKDDIDNYQLELSDSGKTALLVSKIKSHSGFWNGDSPHIDLKVTMPANMMLNVDDGSGSTSIININGAIDVKDGTGELTIKNIANNLKINDGSGGLYVSDIFGNVSIVDGSGELELSDVNGNLNINDGSGSLDLKHISGNVIVEDGSGDLTIKNIAGMVTIDDGSGGIDVDQVGGLTIIESGSGALRVKNVKGGFEINE